MHTRYFRIAFLSIAFVFLFQTFFYVKEFEIGYFVSKIGIPIFGIALALIFLIIPNSGKSKTAAAYWTIFFAAYFFSFGVIASLFHYEQDFQTTLTSQAKILPFFVYFVVLLLLQAFKVRERELFQGIIATGLILSLVYIYAATTINVGEYWTQESSIFVNDAKGFRIRFPSALPIIAFFLCAHYLRRRANKYVIAAFCIIGYFLIFEMKQRVELISIALAVIAIAFTGRRLIAFYLISLCIIVFVTFLSITEPSLALDFELSEDTSWLARARQIDYVTEVIREHPSSLIFGVGKLSEIGDFGYEAYLGFKFTTADLGWIGVMHEYGVAGVILLAFMVYLIFKSVDRASKIDSEYYSLIASSLKSYLIMSIFLSIIAPRFLYLSGVFFAIYAIGAYISDISQPKREKPNLRAKVQP